jgi:hypothetical protein
LLPPLRGQARSTIRKRFKSQTALKILKAAAYLGFGYPPSSAEGPHGSDFAGFIPFLDGSGVHTEQQLGFSNSVQSFRHAKMLDIYQMLSITILKV